MTFKIYLIKFDVGRLILSSEIKEELLHIPVEQGVEVCLDVIENN